MNYSTIVPSVRAVDHRGITKNRTPQRDISIHTDDSPQGALTQLREDRREFAFGVMRPETGLIGEKTYETSFSQTMENIRKEHAGALTGFYNRIHGFAFGIMRPETGMTGEKIYNSSHSMTMKNLKKEHIGTAAGIRDALHQYTKTALESMGPPVAFIKPIQILSHNPQDIQHVDMVT